jgi:hypothetical protein
VTILDGLPSKVVVVTRVGVGEAEEEALNDKSEDDDNEERAKVDESGGGGGGGAAGIVGTEEGERDREDKEGSTAFCGDLKIVILFFCDGVNTLTV